MTTIDDLREISERGGCVYLGQPYSLYKPGLHAAALNGSMYAAALMKLGIRVFSPISHSHSIAFVGGFEPTHAGLWEWADEWFVRHCDALVVLQLEGWQTSKGLAHEIAEFTAARKPILYIDPQVLGGDERVS